jgi:hypothetical protein
LIILGSIVGFSLNATTPLSMEMCVEETYPAPEAASGGIVSLIVRLLNRLQFIIVIRHSMLAVQRIFCCIFPTITNV